MPDRTDRVREISDTYYEILQQLNYSHLPEWLHLDLTFQQMKILYILKLSGKLKMRDLSLRMRVTMPTITGIVNRLIERKDETPLLSRSISSEDRREVWAQLTPAGEEALDLLNKINFGLLQEAMSQLSEADLESIQAPFGRLLEAIKDQKRVGEPAPQIPISLEKETLLTQSLEEVMGRPEESVKETSVTALSN